MAWTHLEKPSMVRCTKSLASEFATMDPAPHDRVFRPSIATHLKSSIEEGRFRLADFASVACKETGKTYRVNGKHTSTVLSEMNGHFPKDLWAIVEKYQADTLQDVASLYATFDHMKSIRNRGDINKAFAAANPDLAEVPIKLINVSASGIAYSMWEDGYASHDAEECAALLCANPDFVLWTYFLLKGDSKKLRHMTRRSVFAAMFKTFNRSQKASTEFWEMVRDESHPTNSHPTRKLSRHLLTHSMRHRDEYGKDCDSWHSMYARCLHAWNAFRTGSTTDLKYYPKAGTPAAK